MLGTHPFGDGTLPGSDAPIAEGECIDYALTLPTSAITAEVRGRRDLDQVLRMVRAFKPMEREGMAELLSRSRPYAPRGRYERYKTTAAFDGTVRNPGWLGADDAASAGTI